MIDINNSSSEKTKAVFEEFLSSCILQGNEVGEYIQFAYLPEERSKRLADVLLYAPFVKAEKSGYKGKYDFFSMHDSAALLKAYNDMKDNDVVIAKYTSDFLGALRLYIQFVASVSLIQNKSKELLSNNLQFFRDFLINCCVSERGKGEFFKVGAQTNYTNKAKRDTLYDYDITLPESKKVDIYTCNDALYLLFLLNGLMKNKKFLERDESNNQHYRSRGLMFYIIALSIRDFITGQNFKGTMSHNKPFSINEIIKKIESSGLIYPAILIKRFAFSLLTKPFVILSGLAGSGKTQLALAFANSICENPEEQVCMVPVGADWTNREPLLGYANALMKDDYVKPESGVLDLIINASANETKPYFLILDEMNMSYVERYFADFLSAMESGKYIHLWDGNNTSIPKSVALPKNLFIVGTINVDETTYMFSPKVLDRANVIEFKVTHDDMEKYLDAISPVNVNGLRAEDALTGEAFVSLAHNNSLAPNDKTKSVLMSFFDELKKVNAEFGYRSAKEIYRFIDVAERYDDTEQRMTTDEIVDAAIMQKLLPKLHGSRTALKDVLCALWILCFKGEIPDLTVAEKSILSSADGTLIKVIFRESADKIIRMYYSAVANGFTSYAEA